MPPASCIGGADTCAEKVPRDGTWSTTAEGGFGFPRGARFAIVMAEPDWDLVLAAHPARPVASRASRP